jgi:hypothetical protein
VSDMTGHPTRFLTTDSRSILDYGQRTMLGFGRHPTALDDSAFLSLGHVVDSLLCRAMLRDEIGTCLIFAAAECPLDPCFKVPIPPSPEGATREGQAQHWADLVNRRRDALVNTSKAFINVSWRMLSLVIDNFVGNATNSYRSGRLKPFLFVAVKVIPRTDPPAKTKASPPRRRAGRQVHPRASAVEVPTDVDHEGFVDVAASHVTGLSDESDPHVTSPAVMRNPRLAPTHAPSASSGAHTDPKSIDDSMSPMNQSLVSAGALTASPPEESKPLPLRPVQEVEKESEIESSSHEGVTPKASGVTAAPAMLPVFGSDIRPSSVSDTTVAATAASIVPGRSFLLAHGELLNVLDSAVAHPSSGAVVSDGPAPAPPQAAPRPRMGSAVKRMKEAVPVVRGTEIWADFQLEIVDLSSGMEPSDAARIFELGEQLQGHATGTGGQGLNIILRAVTELGGRVFVSTKPGVGSNVGITFPVRMFVDEGPESGVAPVYEALCRPLGEMQAAAAGGVEVVSGVQWPCPESKGASLNASHTLEPEDDDQGPEKTRRSKSERDDRRKRRELERRRSRPIAPDPAVSESNAQSRSLPIRSASVQPYNSVSPDGGRSAAGRSVASEAMGGLDIPTPLRIALLDDEPTQAEMFARVMRRESVVRTCGAEWKWFHRAIDLLECLAKGLPLDRMEVEMSSPVPSIPTESSAGGTSSGMVPPDGIQSHARSSSAALNPELLASLDGAKMVVRSRSHASYHSQGATLVGPTPWMRDARDTPDGMSGSDSHEQLPAPEPITQEPASLSTPLDAIMGSPSAGSQPAILTGVEAVPHTQQSVGLRRGTSPIVRAVNGLPATTIGPSLVASPGSATPNEPTFATSRGHAAAFERSPSDAERPPPVHTAIDLSGMSRMSVHWIVTDLNLRSPVSGNHLLVLVKECRQRLRHPNRSPARLRLSGQGRSTHIHAVNDLLRSLSPEEERRLVQALGNAYVVVFSSDQPKVAGAFDLHVPKEANEIASQFLTDVQSGAWPRHAGTSTVGTMIE